MFKSKERGDLGVPLLRGLRQRGAVLVVRDDTYKVAKDVETMIGQLGLHERRNIDHGITLVNQQLDFKTLYEMLNLVPQ